MKIGDRVLVIAENSLGLPIGTAGRIGNIRPNIFATSTCPTEAEIYFKGYGHGHPFHLCTNCWNPALKVGTESETPGETN